MEHILLPIIRRLSEGIPKLMLVDEDYGQLEMLDDAKRDSYAITFPAVLIDLEEVSWDGIAGDGQYGTASIKARLVIDCYDDTHAGSGTEEFIQERSALRWRMHSLLQGFSVAEDSGGLIREESKFYTWRHGIKVYEERYSCRVVELTSPQKATAPQGLRLGISSSLGAS